MCEKEWKVENENGARLFNFRPLFFSALFLALGILFGYFQNINGGSAWWLCLLLPALGLPFFFCKNRENVFLSVIALAIFFALGNILFGLSFSKYESAVAYSEKADVVGRIVGLQANGEYVKVVLDRLYINGNAEKWKLIAYLPATYADILRLSDEVMLSGNISIRDGYSVLNGISGGDIADGLKYSMFAPADLTVVGHSFDLFLAIRQSMAEWIRVGMDEGSAGLMLAILLGDTSGVGSVALGNVRLGGIAHVFAVSGLHVGVLYSFSKLLAEKCKFPKWLCFGFVFFVLILYGGVCGYSSSVIRAIVTCLCFYLAREIGIKADFMEIISFAAIAVLAIFPTLLFDVGFQLSYGACMGLSCFSKPFTRAFERAVFFVSTLGKSKEERAALLKEKDNSPSTIGERVKSWLIGVVASTLAAQAFTLPIMVNTFGYVSLLSLPLNCIVVPILVALFPVFLAVVAIVCVFPFLAVYLLYLPSVTWHAIILPFEVLDLSKTALMSWTISGGAALLYFAGLILLSGKINVKGLKKWSMVAVYFVLCLASILIGNL